MAWVLQGGGAIEVTIKPKSGSPIDIGIGMLHQLLISNQYCLFKAPQLGVSFAMLELKCSIIDYEKVAQLQSSDSINVSVKLGASPDALTAEQNFIVTNMDLEFGAEVQVTLYAVQLFGESNAFTTELQQKVYPKKKSLEAIEEALGSALVQFHPDDSASLGKIKGSLSDKMTWIQAGESAFSFINMVSKHSWSNSDLILLSTHSDKMKIVSVKDAASKSKSQIKTAIGISADDLKGFQYIFECSRPMVSTAIGFTAFELANNQQNLVKIGEKKVTELQPVTKAGPFQDAKTQVLSTLLDAGNTHDDYAKAGVENRRKLIKLLATMFVVEIDNYVIQDEIKMLDVVYLDLKFANNTSSYTQGNYIVLGVDRFVANDKTSVRVTLVRANAL